MNDWEALAHHNPDVRHNHKKWLLRALEDQKIGEEFSSGEWLNQAAIYSYRAIGNTKKHWRQNVGPFFFSIQVHRWWFQDCHRVINSLIREQYVVRTRRGYYRRIK